jgi:hypothetical protein
MKDFPIHPAAEIFPAMRPEEFAALKADIKANGQRDPVTLHEGTLLDGRNRARACRELKIECKTEEWGGEGGDPVAFVLSRNLHRRHLDTSGRAMVAARIANLPKGWPAVVGDNGSIDPLSISEPQAGELLNVSVPSVKRARRVIRDAAPSLLEAVEASEVRVGAAVEVSRLPRAEQEKVVAAGPKAVAKRAAELRHAGTNGRAKKGARRAKKPAPWLSEAEMGDGLAAVESLLKKWGEVGSLRKLLKDWEDPQLWQLCGKMEALGRTLLHHATDLKEYSRRRQKV